MTIEEILVDVFSLSRSAITDALELRQIASWDSMSHMVLITQIEEKFDVQLTGDEIADLRSVSDIRDALRRRNVSV